MAAGAASLLAATAILATEAPAANAAKAKIVSPKEGAHVRGEQVSVTVRASGKRFRAYVDGRDVTDRFERAGGNVRRAVLVRGQDFGPLDSNLLIRVGPRFDATTDSTTFIHMQSADVATVKAKRDRSARPAPLLRARTKRKIWESKVIVNGRRIKEGIRHHDDDRGLSFGLGAHHGLRYGANRIAVQLLQRDGRYERHTHVLRIPRSRTLTGAGPDRTVGVGETIALDGSATTPPQRGQSLEYSWEIVAAPPGSAATLDSPVSVAPQLTPDVPGRYTVRLTADAEGPAAAGVDEVIVSAPPSDDPMGSPIQTITADGSVVVGSHTFQRCSHWVMVVYLSAQDLTPDTRYGSPGCAPGSKSYTADKPSSLTSDLQNVSPHDIVIVTGQGKPAAGPGIANPGHLSSTQANALATAIKTIGGTTASYGTTKNGAADLANGQFSVLGHRGLTEGHAEQNYLITQAPVLNPTFTNFPTGAGLPGSLNGFMQKVNDGGAYQYISTEYLELDTKYTPTLGENPPTNQNTVKVGDQLIKSGTIGDQEVGVQLVVLDQSAGGQGPAVLENNTWRILQASGDPDYSGVYWLANRLDHWVRANHAAGSSQLVIVQDFGNHFGWNGPGQKSVDWVSDTLPETTGQHAWEGDRYSLSPDDLFRSWNQRNIGCCDGKPKGFGTVAGNIGMLVGPAAHDAVANYRIPFFDPSQNNGKGAWTSNDSPGLTAVASTNLFQWSSAFFQGQRFNAHQEKAQVATGRVTGVLRRNEQSQWELSSSALAPGYTGLAGANGNNEFNPQALWDLVFQKAQAWPCSPQNPSPCPAQPTQECPTPVATDSPSEMRNAMLYMAQHYQPEQGKGFTDIRQLYADGFKSSFIASDLAPYPGDGNGFSKPVYEALRCQIALEFGYIADVRTGISNWQAFLTSQGNFGGSPEALIKGVSQKIQSNLNDVYRKIASEETTSNAGSISSDILLVLSTVIEGGIVAGAPETAAIAPPVLGGISALIDLGDDSFEEANGDGGSSTQEAVANDTDAVRDRGQNLAQDVNARYEAIARTMEHFGNVFVSDWGKLQGASLNLRPGGIWAFPSDATTETRMQLSMSVAAERAAYEALLPEAFSQWIISPSDEDQINPGGPANIDNRNPYKCIDTNDDDGYSDHRNPFDHASLWALQQAQWIGDPHPQIGSQPTGATPYTLRGLKSKADDMQADSYPYSDSQDRVGLSHGGTSASGKILGPLFSPLTPFAVPENPGGLGVRKEEIFGLGTWNSGGKEALKKLQCA